MKKRKLFVNLITLACVFPCIVLGGVFFVSPQGDNQNQGSEAHPWRTVQYAIDHARAGDTVYVRQGTYYESLRFNNYSGTLQSPIVFQNYPGESVTIESVTASGGDPAMCIGVSHIQIRGFKVHKATQSAGPVDIVGGTHVLLDSLEIWGPGSWDCVSVTNENGESSYITIKNCNIHTALHEGIYVRSETSNPIHHLYFENNVIHDCGDEAFQISGEDSPSNPPTDIFISRNEIYDVGAWAIIHLYYAPQRVTIEGNNIHDNTAAWVGISLDGASAIIRNNILSHNSGGNSTYSFSGIHVSNSHGTPDFQIDHNTFINLTRGVAPAAYGIFIRSGAGTSNSFIKNNIFYQIQDYAINNDYASLPESEGNLFYHDSMGNAVYDNGQAYTYQNVSTWGSGNVYGDPLFIDPINRDFHLQANSPAIDAGVDSGTSTDIESVMRPQGGGFDIGAYEFLGMLTPSPPTKLEIITRKQQLE